MVTMQGGGATLVSDTGNGNDWFNSNEGGVHKDNKYKLEWIKCIL